MTIELGGTHGRTRTISDAELKAAKSAKSEKDVAAGFWSKIADWYCGTNKAEAMKQLFDFYHNQDKAEPFMALRDLASPAYQDRFSAEKTIDNHVEFRINVDNGKNDILVQSEGSTKDIHAVSWLKIENCFSKDDKPQAMKLFFDICANPDKSLLFLELKNLAALEYRENFTMQADWRNSVALSIHSNHPANTVTLHSTDSIADKILCDMLSADVPDFQKISCFEKLQHLNHPDFQNNLTQFDTVGKKGRTDKNWWLALSHGLDFKLTLTDIACDRQYLHNKLNEQETFKYQMKEDINHFSYYIDGEKLPDTSNKLANFYQELTNLGCTSEKQINAIEKLCCKDIFYTIYASVGEGTREATTTAIYDALTDFTIIRNDDDNQTFSVTVRQAQDITAGDGDISNSIQMVKDLDSCYKSKYAEMKATIDNQGKITVNDVKYYLSQEYKS